ncbi:MAG: hypothetical protein ABIN61_06620 [candidate division WOR-3 bacterium]
MRKKKKSEARIVLRSSQIAPWKRILFVFFLFLIPVFIFMFLEGILRILNYGGDLRLFISAPEEVSDYYRCNPDVGKRYFYRQVTVPDPPKDLFLKKKPKNGYRIFVLGESTTAGFPYGNNLMFPRILWRRLQDTFPGMHIEVVNTAMAAINSYALLDFMDEIVKYKPDLILIYAGHNEFYGALGVCSFESPTQSRLIAKVYLRIVHLRLFLLLRDLISKIKGLFSKGKTKEFEDFTATLMERIVGKEDIPFGSDLYERGKEQFRRNLEDILKLAKRTKVPVVLSELVSNFRGQPPFKSAKGGNFPLAEEVYKEAQNLEAQGNYKKAKELYVRAKDLDCLRFRAPEDFNLIIHELALKYKTPVVPMKKIFEENSPNGIIGDELMLDHLHPNVKGYFLMADGFYRTLQKEGYISEKWDSSKVKDIEFYERDWGITELDTIYGNLSIRWLKGGWPFQPKELQNTSLKNFIPRNKIDSVALQVLIDEKIGIEVGHLKLAHYYEDRREYEKAYKEYKALIYTIPHEVMFYEGAAKMLIELKKEEEAISVLEESLKIINFDFAIKWLTHLYLKKGDIEKALMYLDEASSTLKKDREFLNTLAHVYIVSGQFDKLYRLLEYFGPRKREILKLIKYEKGTKTQAFAENYNYVAKIFLKEKDLSTAFLLLSQSLDLKETGIANKFIGEILLFRKEFDKALLYLQRAEELGLKDPDLYYNMAAANYYLDKKKEALRYLKKLKAIRPNHPDPSGLEKKLKLVRE